MGTFSLYGWLVLAAFTLFVISLGWVSEMTEAASQGARQKRPRSLAQIILVRRSG
jgi:hypothetical protein